MIPLREAIKRKTIPNVIEEQQRFQALRPSLSDHELPESI